MPVTYKALRRLISSSFLSLALLVSVLQPMLVFATGARTGNAAPGLPGASQQPELPIFPETGYRLANAKFADYFTKRGGLRTFGYPVSRAFLFLGTEVQFFQRQIMQLKPDGGVGTLNILDADLMPYTRINGSVFPASDPTVIGGAPDPAGADYATKVIDHVRANSPDEWNGLRPNFGQSFMNTVKYEEAFPDQALGPGIMPTINLELWGIPTSKPAFDPSNGAFAYLRFQRGIMHFDANSGATQGLLLADYLKAILTGQNLPADLESQARTSRFYKQYDPTRARGLARLAQLPGTDLIGAFVPDTLGAVPAVPQRSTLKAPAYDATRLGYGMAVHLWWQPMPRVATLVKDAGFGWVRQQIRWADLEPVKGQIDYAEVDRMVDEALKHNLNVLMSVVSSPAWARADRRTNGPPDDLDDFAEFVNGLASRYRDQVRAYEVWNEQNFSREWGGGQINAGQYVEMMKLAYPAIKAADSNAIVIIGGLTPTGFTDPNVAIDDVLYLEQMYQYQGGVIRNYMDAVGAHAGGYNNPPEADPVTSSRSTARFKSHPSFYFRRIEQLRAVMVRYGDSLKKMWITEFGWSTSNLAPGYEYGRDNTEADQASYLVRAFTMTRQQYSWVGVMFVWNLNFATLPELPVSDEKPPFGIVNRDWTPRPAYTALKNMVK